MANTYDEILTQLEKDEKELFLEKELEEMDQLWSEIKVIYKYFLAFCLYLEKPNDKNTPRILRKAEVAVLQSNFEDVDESNEYDYENLLEHYGFLLERKNEIKRSIRFLSTYIYQLTQNMLAQYKKEKIKAVFTPQTPNDKRELETGITQVQIANKVLYEYNNYDMCVDFINTANNELFHHLSNNNSTKYLAYLNHNYVEQYYTLLQLFERRDWRNESDIEAWYNSCTSCLCHFAYLTKLTVTGYAFSRANYFSENADSLASRHPDLSEEERTKLIEAFQNNEEIFPFIFNYFGLTNLVDIEQCKTEYLTLEQQYISTLGEQDLDNPEPDTLPLQQNPHKSTKRFPCSPYILGQIGYEKYRDIIELIYYAFFKDVMSKDDCLYIFGVDVKGYQPSKEKFIWKRYNSELQRIIYVLYQEPLPYAKMREIFVDKHGKNEWGKNAQKNIQNHKYIQKKILVLIASTRNFGVPDF